MALGTWEGVGQFTGTWLGAVMMLATVPVITVDGPLPIADYAWLYANARNTNNLRKKGGEIGAGLDDYLAEGAGSTPGASWSTSPIAPKTPSKKDTPYNFNKLPGGSGIEFGSFLSFDPMQYDFSHMEFNYQVETVQDLTYIYRNSEWPSWSS
jgi:hypothetical protein